MERNLLDLKFLSAMPIYCFLQKETTHKRRRKRLIKSSEVNDVMTIIAAAVKSSEETLNVSTSTATEQLILEAELDLTKQELNSHQEAKQYQRTHYSVSVLSPEVIRMETGLPTKQIFNIVVDHTAKVKDSISYYAGWKVKSISFEDQIFITLLKLRQNYTNLHLAQYFSCSVKTISNIVTTFVHILHKPFFEDIKTTIQSRNKNKVCSPSSFSHYSGCRIVIDCTDIEVATPSRITQQNATYSSYRGMNYFKVLTGVAPNGVLTYISSLYPGSISDKEIVQGSGLLNHLVPGDLILAD